MAQLKQSYKVIRPKLVDNYYNINKDKFINGNNLLSPHNFKLKGGDN